MGPCFDGGSQWCDHGFMRAPNLRTRLGGDPRINLRVLHSLGLQIAQSRSYLYASGPKVGSTCILGALGIADPEDHGKARGSCQVPDDLPLRSASRAAAEDPDGGALSVVIFKN